MELELEMEAMTITAIAEAIEYGENEPSDYAIALQGVAARLKKIGEKRNE